MLDLLYEVIYAMLIGIAILNFAISWLMSFFRFGRAYILSAIIGTAVGWLIIWISPASYAGMIVGVIVTIIANLILTNIIYPKLEDKADEYFDKKTDQRITNDSHKAIYSATQEERVKYLCRIMRDNLFYCFQPSVSSTLVYQAVKDTIGNSALSTEYPNLRIVFSTDCSCILFHIETELQAVGFEFTQAKKDSRDVFMLGIYAYGDNGKLKERIAFENWLGHLLDNIYILTLNAIKKIDASCKVDIVRYSSSYAAGRIASNMLYRTGEDNENIYAAEQAESTIESSEWVCSKCGWVNSAGQDECIGCGHAQALNGKDGKIKNEVVIKNPISSPDSPATSDEWVCPKCKWINSIEQNECIGCGISRLPTKIIIRKTKARPNEKLQSVNASTKSNHIKLKRCKKCGGYVAGVICPKCGSKV